jgi:hypothetical protein
VEILNVSEFEKKMIKPFIVFGFDLFNAGMIIQGFGFSNATTVPFL